MPSASCHPPPPVQPRDHAAFDDLDRLARPDTGFTAAELGVCVVPRLHRDGHAGGAVEQTGVVRRRGQAVNDQFRGRLRRRAADVRDVLVSQFDQLDVIQIGIAVQKAGLVAVAHSDGQPSSAAVGQGAVEYLKLVHSGGFDRHECLGRVWLDRGRALGAPRRKTRADRLVRVQCGVIETSRVLNRAVVVATAFVKETVVGVLVAAGHDEHRLSRYQCRKERVFHC